MDQVKIYLAWLVKHHFWVLSGTTVVLGLIGWFLSANALADYYKLRKTKIESEFTKAQKITATPNHPNPSFEAGVNKLLDQPGAGLKSRVLAAWNHCYDEQKNEVLIWPKAMGEESLRVIAAVGDGEIPIDIRERYFNYVRSEFPQLLAIVDAENYNESGGDRAGQRGRTDENEPVRKQKSHKVIWCADDQRLLDEVLDWPRTPTSKEMRYIQENLWVYNSLLRIIAKVNENATAHYNAKIKEIISVQIARPAAQEFQYGMSAGKLVPPQLVNAPTDPGAAGAAPVPMGARRRRPIPVRAAVAVAARAAVVAAVAEVAAAWPAAAIAAARPRWTWRKTMVAMSTPRANRSPISRPRRRNSNACRSSCNS